MSLDTYDFTTVPPLNIIPIDDNANKILNLRYFMDFKNENYKEKSYEELCRRVAKVVASSELKYYFLNDNDNKLIMNRLNNIEDSIYSDMISHRFLFNSPALFSTGVNQKTKDLYDVDKRDLTLYDNIQNNITQDQMMFACFAVSVDDSLEGIFDSAKNAAIISKFGGGVGANFGNLREKDALIKNGNIGKSSGPISFMQVWNTMGSVVVQGGKRRAALMGMLYSNHPDIEEFITCKTEDNNLSYFNISVAIDDLFMKAVKEDLDYCLISPKDNKIVKTIKAKDLWEIICTSAHKRGDPGIFFIDMANADSLLKDDTDKYKISTTNPCVSGDTLVATDKGYKFARDIDLNDKLITVLGIEDIKTMEINKNVDLYKLEMFDGGSVKVTAKHQFQARKSSDRQLGNKKYDFIKVEDLEIGDSIRVSPTILPDNKINTFGFDDFDLGTIIGVMLSDMCEISCTSDFFDGYGKINIFFNKENILWARNFVSLLEKYNMNVYKNLNECGYDISIYESKHENNDIVEVIKHYGISDFVSRNKKLSWDLINSNKHVLAGILNGYISTNAEVSLSKTEGHLVLTVNDKKLLENLRHILLCFGIYAKYNYLFDIMYLNGESIKKLLDNVIVSNNIFTNLDLVEQLKTMVTNYITPSESWESTIKSFEYIGKETVYDFYCEKSDTWITNGYVSRGCGEQPLPDYTSCNLGSINVSEFVKDNSFDIKAFEEQILRAVYYLDLVIDTTRYPLSEIEERTKAIRPIGLGIMGLADLAIKLNIKYGSEEFLKLCDLIGSTMASMSLLGTIEIARLKGSYDEYKNITLPLFQSVLSENVSIDKSKIHAVYDRLINSEEIPYTFRNAMKKLFEHENNLNWLSDMFTYGLRNSRRLSIAPTGTIALILNTSSSIEPNFAFEWTRTVTVDANTKQDITYYHKLYNDDNKNKGLLVNARDLSIEGHVGCVACFAKYIDSGQSKTVNLSYEATVEDVKKIYDYCFENKIKGITIYRDGSRSNQPLVAIESKPDVITEDEKVTTVSKDNDYKSIRVRPKIMKGLTTKSDSPYGSIYVTANFDDDNKIFETFITAGKSGSVSKSVTEAMSRVISLALRANVDINDIIQTISNISGSDLWVYETIDDKEVYVKSIPDATAKMLADLNSYSIPKKDVKDEVKLNNDTESIHNQICPECGKNMIMISGCQCCTNCGYSPCR